MKTREKISIILNSLIFIFTLFATISMIIGFKFMGAFEVLSSRNFQSFRFFTVDSNVFAGGLNTIWFVIPILYISTWIFAFGLWAANKKFAKA